MKINLPTKFTIARIVMIPFMIWAYLSNILVAGKLIALILFVVAAATDFIDGYLARKYNLVTNLGKLLDPIADKLLTMSALLLLVADGTILAPYGAIFAIIIIGREFAVSALRQLCASQNYVMAADKYGKLKTIAQDIAIPLYIFVAFLRTLNQVATTTVNMIEMIAFAVLIISVILTILSGVNYFMKNKNIIKQE